MDKHIEFQIILPENIESIHSELKPQSPEPEVEECCEDNQIKEIMGGLGLDPEMFSQLKSIRHSPESPSCPHCKLIETVKSLQMGILKLSSEIETTEEILKYKRMQNRDVKNIIDKIEGTIETTEITNDYQKESRGINCSCNKQCLIM